MDSQAIDFETEECVNDTLGEAPTEEESYNAFLVESRELLHGLSVVATSWLLEISDNLWMTALAADIDKWLYAAAMFISVMDIEIGMVSELSNREWRDFRGMQTRKQATMQAGMLIAAHARTAWHHVGRSL